MLDEDNIREITDSWSFQTNLHIVANSLGISDSEAQSLLLMECVKRHIETPLTTVMQWRITYARKDIVSRYYRDQRKNENLKEKLSFQNEPQSLNENLKDLDINYVQLMEIIKASFPNRKTQQFVQSVLDNGATQTMADLGITKRQFNRKLKKICDYASHHRGKFSAVIDQQERNKLQTERAILMDYVLILENRSSPEPLIEELIQNNQEYFEDFIGLIPNVNQCTLLRHFCMANKKDMYKFNEAVNARLAGLEKKLQSAENSAD